MHCDRWSSYITNACNYSDEIRQFSHYGVTNLLVEICVPQIITEILGEQY